MMPNMSGRVQAIVLLALVATTGALAGVVGDRLLRDRDAPAFTGADMQEYAPPAGGPWRWEPQPDARYSERLVESLSLTPDQESTINLIVAEEQGRVRELTFELQPQFRAIAEETRGRIENVLTPQQRQQLRTLREERMRGMGMGPGAGMRGFGGREMRDSAMLHMRDSIMRERRDSIMRERNGLIMERRDSVMRQLRRLPPEVRDSVIMELRSTLPAQRDSMMRLRQQRMRALPDSVGG
jgi:hypothetical protein